jgi:hypothetical protein
MITIIIFYFFCIPKILIKLPSIETILNLTPIDGADKIEIATVLGCQVIVKKEEYNIGDLSVFIPIDTTIDPNRECFKFLKNSKNLTKRIIIMIKIKIKKIKCPISIRIIV